MSARSQLVNPASWYFTISDTAFRWSMYLWPPATCRMPFNILHTWRSGDSWWVSMHFFCLAAIYFSLEKSLARPPEQPCRLGHQVYRHHEHRPGSYGGKGGCSVGLGARLQE